MGDDQQKRDAYWKKYNDNVERSCPADRDATLLKSQLEPWSTATLRDRLVNQFGKEYAPLDGMSRHQILQHLLTVYQETLPQGRKIIRVQGTPLLPDHSKLLDEVLTALKEWRKEQGAVNTRPSIRAESYMILRKEELLEEKEESENKDHGIVSRRAKSAQKKLNQYQHLWTLANQIMSQVDPEFAKSFSALAVTYGFTGSPHIDKQNTTPFYGLALGEFVGGGICVEADWDTVAISNSHNRLAKVDGRYPHWVEPYEGERYSLIFYSTTDGYQKPGPPFYGQVVSVAGDG